MGLDLIVTYNLGYISLKRNLGNISASRYYAHYLLHPAFVEPKCL